MRATGWIVVGLAVFVAGWLLFDGMHGLVTGDYVTPSSGRFAGQLGPWSKLVEAVGIEPRSTLMMTSHVAIGVAWLAIVGFYVKGVEWGRWGMIAGAAASLWYLPFGTLLGVVQIVLLASTETRVTRPVS